MRTRGFTLIELLVVISIIGALSSVIVGSLSIARKKADDAQRLSEMHQIQTALSAYYMANGTYPTSNGSGCGGWESTYGDAAIGQNFVAGLVSGNTLAKGIHDPVPSLENTCGNYAYYFYPAGSYGCDATRGGYYVFGIRSTDQYNTGVYPTSPGWSCPGRDWQGEFSWVTGQFIQ